MHLLAGATGWSNSCCPWPSCRDAKRPPHLREGNIEALIVGIGFHRLPLKGSIGDL